MALQVSASTSTAGSTLPTLTSDGISGAGGDTSTRTPPEGPWTCRNCAYALNGVRSNACEICYAQRYKITTTAPSLQPATQLVAPPAPPASSLPSTQPPARLDEHLASGEKQDGLWTCRVCAYAVNDTRADVCEICHAHRYKVAQLVAPAQPPSTPAVQLPARLKSLAPTAYQKNALTPALVIANTTPSNWQCSTCRCSNHFLLTSCGQCGKPRLQRARPPTGTGASPSSSTVAASVQDLLDKAMATRHLELQPLKAESAEFIEVARVMKPTSYRKRVTSVVKILRCFQTPRVNGVRRDYEECGHFVTPRLFWHGTDLPAIEAILSKGFAVPPNARNGRAYGHGIYLSPVEMLRQSIKYCRHDGTGTRHLLLCHLYARKTEQLKANGSSWQVEDPEAEAAESRRMLVVFQAHCNTALLPMYIISFK